MATITLDYFCDLKKAVKVHYVDGMVFSGDNGGNTINVFVMDGDNPANISGDVIADVIRSDGGTVAVTGAIEGNKAYIILPAACYSVPGVISIVIKISQGTTITTICALVANVYRSSTDVAIDPGTIMPTIEYLINQINTAVNSIPLDYSNLWKTTREINEWLTEETGVTHYIFNVGAWIPTTATTVDPTNIVENSDAAYIVIDCLPGEVFHVTARGVNSSHRPWSFIDGENNVKSQATVTGVTNATITAPAESTKLVINAVTAGYFCYKGESRITNIETKNNEQDQDIEIVNGWLSQETGVTNYILDYGYVSTNATAFTPSITHSSSFKCAIIDCVAGDKFAVKASYASSEKRPWTFLDASDNVLSQANSNAVETVITAPTNAVKLVFNSGRASSSDPFTCYCKKGASRIDGLETDVSKLNEVADDYSYNVMEWRGNPTSDSPLGWRQGWIDNDGVRQSGKFICIVGLYAAGVVGTYAPKLTGVKFVRITPPAGYYVNIKKFSYISDTITFIENKSSYDTFDFAIEEGYLYSIHIGEFSSTTDAENHLTQTFVDSCIVKMFYEYGETKKPFTYRSTRFTVPVNLGWYDINDTTDDNAEESDPTNIRCIVELPLNYSPVGKPTPLIMICHGYNGYISDLRWNENGADYLALVNAFRDAGYAVFGVNNTRDNSGGWADWGCLPLMSAFIKAWDYIKQNYNVEKELFIYSYSMGTAAALNMLKWYGSQIKTTVQAAPRPLCQSRYEAYTEGDTRATQFEASFGLADGWDDERLSGFNHVENAIEIGNKTYIMEHFPPTKVIVGKSDTDFLTDVRNYYAWLKNAGNVVNYREITGFNHYDTGYLTSANLRQEVIDWFNRFRD